MAIKVPFLFPTADRSTRLYIAMTIAMAFAIRLAGDLRPVPGDRIQLQQVLLNLVLNANEAMREPGDGNASC